MQRFAKYSDKVSAKFRTTGEMSTHFGEFVNIFHWAPVLGFLSENPRFDTEIYRYIIGELFYFEYRYHISTFKQK
jgi:hypothetical protein